MYPPVSEPYLHNSQPQHQVLNQPQSQPQVLNQPPSPRIKAKMKPTRQIETSIFSFFKNYFSCIRQFYFHFEANETIELLELFHQTIFEKYKIFCVRY